MERRPSEPSDICKNVYTEDAIIVGIAQFTDLGVFLKPFYKKKKKKNYNMTREEFNNKYKDYLEEGFEELAKYFDGIYCTNSYKDIIDTTALCGFTSTKSVGELVKQLNVF